jgi:hypothetical protein
MKVVGNESDFERWNENAEQCPFDINQEVI